MPQLPDMTLEEFYTAVQDALQAEPYLLSPEDAVAATEAQPKSMKIFRENETVESAAALIMEGWLSLQE